VINNPEIDIVGEFIGGIEPAKTFILKALAAGKYVVTANKALLATHGAELFAVARKFKRTISFEAAVGAGIPIIRSLKEGLVADRIEGIYGILNGTANFILTALAKGGVSFTEALQEAQELGFAEANPALDINGTDTAHKIAILASLAFGAEIDFSKIHIEGIEHLETEDFILARKLGYCLKLLAVAKKIDDRLDLRVHPALLPKDKMLAKVDGVFNGIVVVGDRVGEMIFCGKGAGALPTASGVISNFVGIGRDILAGESFVPMRAFQERVFHSAKLIPPAESASGYYLRFKVENRAGVLAAVTNALSRAKINISEILQEHIAEQSPGSVVLLTYPAKFANLEKALREIAAKKVTRKAPVVMRVESM
jgi:homoserine dehydrogenase